MTPLSFQTMISQDDLFSTGFIKIQKEKKLLEMSLINQQLKIKKSVNHFYNLLTYPLILVYLFMKKTPKPINQLY